MSRLLYHLSYTATWDRPRCHVRITAGTHRAPIRNRTVDLLLTMETLYRLSYWGRRRTRIHSAGRAARIQPSPEPRRVPAGVTRLEVMTTTPDPGDVAAGRPYRVGVQLQPQHAD